MFDDNYLSDSERYYMAQRIASVLAFVGFITSAIIVAKIDARITKKRNNERNASYITGATIDTPYYEWCLDATDINTLVYFENNKAYLYEYDHKLFDPETRLYMAITPNGEYRYIPMERAVGFDNHEAAYEYAYQMLGNGDNIVCVNYPSHSKKLVP